MEGDASSTIDSSSEAKVAMDQSSSAAAAASANNFDGGGGDARVSGAHRISSSGQDEESETDELTIDDSCVNNDDNETADADMDDDSDNNVAIVSSSTLHQIHEEDEEDGCVASSGYMSSEQDAVSVISKPLHDEGDEAMENDEGDDDASTTSQQPIVSTTSSSETVVRNPEVTTTAGQLENDCSQVEQGVAKITKGAEDDDVDIDGIEDNNPVTTTPASPLGPESPPPSQAQSICSPDASSQHKITDSPPQSPEDEVSGTPDPVLPSVTPQIGSQSPQTETIVSQDNFSQFDTSTSNITLSQITSQSSITKTLSSQDSAVKSDEDATMDDDAMDTSQVETSQGGTQQSPDVSENDESQQSSIIAASEKSVANANGAVSKNRSKSRSRSNTEDGDDDDDVDLEDGEIMDDEEEEVKAAPLPPPPKEKKDKEKEKEKSIKSSSSVKERSSEKEKDKSREKDKDKEREKEKHRKDKKRSKREEEKEKEKEKDSSSSKKKKRKASDEAESEQEEYMFVRGASPGSAAHPLPDPWSAPIVEEFGDDSKVSRAKRRRESDGDGSPHQHHHHPSRPPREPTPPGRRMDRNKRPMREERKEPKSDVICAYFMQGKCQKSAMECSFSHDAVPPRKMELCKFWMMECCAKKEKCLYLHNDFPCKYFHTGLICKAGDRCKFSHSALSDVTKQVLLKHIETAPKEILGDFPRLNRQGAINLINKMEARARGEKFDDDKDGFPEMNQNDHHGRGGPPPMPPHERHHHGGRNDERHNSRNNRDHHGGGGGGHHHQGHHNHNQRGGGNNNDIRGGRGNPIDPHQNNRNSRWEQQQPTRDDQEKLQELMEEAGISGFYKDTLETGIPPPGSQSQGPPGQFPPMQPPLLPLNPVLMSQMLPGLLPQGQANSVNNPALANVLATLNIPTTMVPTTLASIPQLNPTTANVPPMSTSQDDSNSDKTIPDHLPKMQKELFMRIQKQQQKNEKKMQNIDKSEPEEPEENWYSSEDEDESKKKEDKTEISDKISSVLNQIRQQTQPQASSSPVLPSSLPLPPVSDSKPPSFYGDTDFRNQPPSFKDIDLRNPSSIFKKIDIEPAKEINASLAHNGPMSYKLRKVAGVPKIDYSSIRLGLPPSSIVLDPRLGPKRNNSIPAPASPTETSAPDVGIQPLTIPDGTPVFDPRTMRGGGQGSSGPGRNVGAPGITPQQNNPFLDSDNRFVSLPNPVNDFPSLFNRDPRGGGGQNSGINQPPPGNPQAQIQAMAAAMAAMQQQLPNMQGPMDPNLLMLGFPFLPQQPGGVQNPLDFQQMLAAGAATGNLRMRPPFTSQQPPSSSWERLNQGQQGQGGGDLTPPL